VVPPPLDVDGDDVQPEVVVVQLEEVLAHLRSELVVVIVPWLLRLK
jgi:hypothetical protein